jgi:uncharacterized protein YggL (DUF469 family)
MMRKRPRKRTPLGACVAWGVPIAVRGRTPDGVNEFLDDLLAQAIAAHGLTCGGGGHDDRLTGVIEVGRAADPIEARLQHIRRWLEAREDVEAYVVGALVDLRQGPFDARDAAPHGFRSGTRASMRVETAAPPPTAAGVALGRDGQASTVTWRTGTCPLQAGESDVQVCGVCRS